MSGDHERRRHAVPIKKGHSLDEKSTEDQSASASGASDTPSSFMPDVSGILKKAGLRNILKLVQTKRDSSSTLREQSESNDAASGASREENGHKHDGENREIEGKKGAKPQEKPDPCPICLDDCTDPKKLGKCGHIFCSRCIDDYFQVKPQCPCCFTIYGEIRGNQPDDGTMRYKTSKRRLPGFKDNSYGTIEIQYHFPDGIQDERHPNPGRPYSGTTRLAYLPENSDGRHVLRLLQKAFELRQVFTIGQSRTTGCDNVVTWNDIHHKTSCYGGKENFGYPDDTYLNRVLQELAAKGIK